MRRRLLLTATVAAAAFLGTTASFAWQPPPCPADVVKQWKEFRVAMTEAAQSSTIYVPHPYPTTPDQILEDLKYTYFRIHGRGKERRVPAHQRKLHRLLESGAFTYQIVRVESWEPDLCSRDRENRYYFLVRIFQPDRRTEVARLALQQCGMLASWGGYPEEHPVAAQRWQASPRPLDEAAREASRIIGAPVSAARYVHAWGLGHLSCDYIGPCVAFEQGDGLYLMAVDGGVFQVQLDGPRYSSAELAHEPNRTDLIRSLELDRQTFVSLGNEGFALAWRLQGKDR